MSMSYKGYLGLSNLVFYVLDEIGYHFIVMSQSHLVLKVVVHVTKFQQVLITLEMRCVYN